MNLILVSLLFLPGLDRARPVQPEPLLAPPIVVYAEPPAFLQYYRRNPYEVWDHLAVDRQGNFRPRVVATPCSAYYSVNGKPYPWVDVNQQYVAPRVLGTPYRR